MPDEIMVIGGGPSGMMAAITAARSGEKVTLLEKNDRVGKKILVTGNGRCNFTNDSVSEINFHGRNPAFVRSALSQFDVPSTLSFFQNLGIELYQDESGRIFPYSQQAGSILDALRMEMENLGIPVIPNTDIGTILPEKGFLTVFSRSGAEFSGKSVILASGGKARPDLGSNGSGLKLAESLNHPVIEPFPSLVQLKLESPFHKAMEGMKWEGIVTVYSNGEKTAQAKGDFLFTDYGISGLAVLAVSRKAVESMLKKKRTEIGLDLVPEISRDEIIKKLRSRVELFSGRTLESFFTGWMNKRIGQTLLKSTGLKLSQFAQELNSPEMAAIASAMKDWRFSVSGDSGWTGAQVCAGGVATESVNPETMESRIVKGLYFAGEILDIDGDSGGYNLQWAWSSGYTAGISAALAR